MSLVDKDGKPIVFPTDIPSDGIQPYKDSIWENVFLWIAFILVILAGLFGLTLILLVSLGGH